MTATEKIRALVRGELEALGRHDAAGLVAHFAPDCELVDLGDGGVVRGRAALLAEVEELLAHVPDLRVAETRMVGEGGVAAAEILLAGTHSVEWRSHAPTGREFSWPTCSFYDLSASGEHIARERMYFDAAQLDRQLSAAGGER
jgi:uncharacterized protein (TIGR02246 family)